MRSIDHPILGPVLWLAVDVQASKVWKHFYSRTESWHRVAAADPAQLRRPVEALLGTTRCDSEKLPWTWLRAEKLLAVHHDDIYGPAYMAELAEPGTICTTTPDASFQRKALTPKGVFVVLRQRGAVNDVATAFCPHPRVNFVLDERDQRNYAARYFERQTIMRPSRNGSSTRDDAVPQTVAELWRQAVEVGESATAQDVRTARLRETVSPELLERLFDSIEWNKAEEAISDALSEDAPEELEGALLDAEELVLVAGVLGREALAAEFLTRLEPVIAWTPASWLAVGELAARRIEALASVHGAPAAALWQAVRAAQLGDALREAAPARRRATRLVDELLPEPGLFDRLQLAITQGIGEGAVRSRDWAGNVLALLRPAPSRPQMGTPATSQWELPGGGPPPAGDVRVFVVDNLYPAGHDVTANWLARVPTWQFEQPGQRALVVLVLSDETIPNIGLPALIAHAETRAGLRVVAREVSRPR